MCGDCVHAVRCVSCSRWRALRNSHQCALLGYYHLHYHDSLIRCGTVEHKMDARLEAIHTSCLTLQEVWAIEDDIRQLRPGEAGTDG